jgi:hypothetical protein
LNRISKELNRCFDVSWCLKGNLQKESVVDEVAEVIPISTSVAEARGWVVMSCSGSEGYQDKGMVGGQVKALLRDGKIRGNTFSNAEIYQIRDFVHVGRPVGRVTRGEVSEVVAVHCFKVCTTTRCDESGSPLSVFGIVVCTCDETGPESNEEIFKLRFADRMFGRKKDSRNC